jgi:Papain family cysteine protease
MLLKQTLFTQSLCLFAMSLAGLSAADYPKGNATLPAGVVTLNFPKSLPTGKLLVGQTLPASVDLRGSSLPKPGFQVGPSCVGWATTFAMKTYQEAQSHGWDVYNIYTYSFTPYWTYDHIIHAADGGSWVPDALEFLRTKGCDQFMHYWPSYAGKPTPGYSPESTQATFAHGMKYQCASWIWLPTDQNTIKSVLAAGRPVVISLTTRAQFDNLGPGGIYNDSTSASTGGHAVSLIGYDDAKGAFLLINSWGANWGTNGYGWIAYSLLGNTITNAYDVIDRPAAETMLSGTISSGVNNGAGYQFRVLHTANPPADMNSSITSWNAFRPNDGTWATVPASATVCELAASEQVILHAGTTLAKGSNAWIHLVPMTQALAN